MALHELGHLEGLGHGHNLTTNGCTFTGTAMMANRPANGDLVLSSPSACDSNAAVEYQRGIYNGTTSTTPHNPSPIIISLDDHQIELSPPDVKFDIRANGLPETVSWTLPNGRDAFLAFDRNGNGWIDSGLELFGDAYGFQNGFLALAEHDKPDNGGNLDGWIDERDFIYPLLRLWFDSNHNGESEPWELMPLAGLRISLDYHTAERRDRYGNLFRYRADAVQSNGTKLAAIDVFLSVLEP